MIHDPRPGLGLRPVINCSGTMTSLGASIAVPEAISAAADILPHFVEIDDLQRLASAAIAKATGAEAGFVSASCSAGISLAIAGCMTGSDLAGIERLPDTSGLSNEVPVQAGHLINYGAPIDQSIRLTGARVVPIGQATSAAEYHLSGALREATAAALYVISHHTVEYGQIPLRSFCAIAHDAGIPVIVDAASEYDLRGPLAAGADIVLYSAHKFLGGLTAGIVAGRRDLVRAAYLHSRGIGRGMKVGKEAMIATIAALEAWGRRDHDAIRHRERERLQLWLNLLDGRPGVIARLSADPTGNPLERLRIDIDPKMAKITAWDLVDRLAAGDPPVICRDHEVEHGYFFLDPCNLYPGEEHVVARRLAGELDAAPNSAIPSTTFAERKRRHDEAALRWPD